MNTPFLLLLGLTSASAFAAYKKFSGPKIISFFKNLTNPLNVKMGTNIRNTLVMNLVTPDVKNVLKETRHEFPAPNAYFEFSLPIGGYRIETALLPIFEDYNFKSEREMELRMPRLPSVSTSSVSYGTNNFRHVMDKNHLLSLLIMVQDRIKAKFVFTGKMLMMIRFTKTHNAPGAPIDFMSQVPSPWSYKIVDFPFEV